MRIKIWLLAAATVATSAAAEPVTPQFCAAIRGNGHYLHHHFGALAKIVETYGVIDGLAGGSSASMTSFLYESMYANPAIATAQTPEGRQARLALLLKSYVGYAQLMAKSPQSVALGYLLAFAEEFKREGFEGTTEEEWQELIIRVVSLMRHREWQDLINPRLPAMLMGYDALGYHDHRFKVGEVIQAITNLSAYDASDAKVFFREGLVNFRGIAEMIGDMGDFYAGYGHESQRALATFVKHCAPLQQGLQWTHLEKIAPPRMGFTCGQLFTYALQTYLQKDVNDPRRRYRLDEAVGKHLLTIPITAILKGDAVDAFHRSLSRYKKGEELDFNPSFSDVMFQYFVPPSYQSRVRARLAEPAYTDAKSAKFTTLSPGQSFTWAQALRVSPLEPGIDRIAHRDNILPDFATLLSLSPREQKRIIATYIGLGGVKGSLRHHPLGQSVRTEKVAYIGGWADLHPVPVLQAAGCETVIYITRCGPETKFVSHPDPRSERERYGLAELLGMNEEERLALYEADNPESAINRSIAGADAVWCTDWDAAGELPAAEMFAHSYSSPISLGARSHQRFAVPSEIKAITAPLVGCRLAPAT